jgi:hypothetical protein
MIIGLIVAPLAIAFIIAGIILKQFTWGQRQPKDEHAGTRYEFLPGCIEWQDMKECIDAVIDATSGTEMKPLWIFVHPYETPIRTQRCPTGYIDASGMPVRRPETEKEAASTRVLVGLTEFERKWPFSKRTAIVHVRQHRPGDTMLDARLLRGKSPIVECAAKSTLIHECIEHVLSMRLGRGTNQNHADARLRDLSRAIQEKLLASPKQ